MAAPDTTTVTGPNFAQTLLGNTLVTPTSGTQAKLADILSTATGGAVAATTLSATSTVTLSPANKSVTVAPSGTGTVVINPATAGTMDAVTIGGTTAEPGTFTLLTAGTIVSSGFIRGSAATGIIAAGTATAGATALTAAFNNVQTVTATNKGLNLPASAAIGVGGAVTIANTSTAAATVFGVGSDKIDGTTGSTGVTLTNA